MRNIKSWTWFICLLFVWITTVTLGMIFMPITFNYKHKRANVPGGVPSHFLRPDNYDHIWPAEANQEHEDDRILQQMDLVETVPNRTFTILLDGVFNNIYTGNVEFTNKSMCPVRNCLITHDHHKARDVDVIILSEYSVLPSHLKPDANSNQRANQNQVVILYVLESPVNRGSFSKYNNGINWTASYRHDSVITAPYARFTFFENYRQTGLPSPQQNYSLNKTKQVAWFVSNCNTGNGRMKYARELQKYISVDIYGGCGNLTCRRHSINADGDEQCYKLLKEQYKFYLAFENSNCKDYITEKLYWNALLNDVVSIVMGARPDQYTDRAPPHSFIHVDDFESPRNLAEYLHKLDHDDSLYNEYFRWKSVGDFINTKFFCRVCSLINKAHLTGKHMWYERIDKWWHGPEVCIEPNRTQKWATWKDINQDFTYSKNNDVFHIN